MTYKGTVRGHLIELEAGVRLPEGLEVQVLVAAGEPGGIQAGRGSPGAVLAALEHPARCSPDDVEALLSAIQEGKRPVRFNGAFDSAEPVE
jgi:hypothetical protein